MTDRCDLTTTDLTDLTTTDLTDLTMTDLTANVSGHPEVASGASYGLYTAALTVCLLLALEAATAMTRMPMLGLVSRRESQCTFTATLGPCGDLTTALTDLTDRPWAAPRTLSSRKTATTVLAATPASRLAASAASVKSRSSSFRSARPPTTCQAPSNHYP
eukprot:4972856-Pyramimonas_sp.AAC.1